VTKLKFKAKVPLPDEIELPERWGRDSGLLACPIVEGIPCCVSMYLGHTLGMGDWRDSTPYAAKDRLVDMGFDEESAHEIVLIHDGLDVDGPVHLPDRRALAYRMALEAMGYEVPK